MGVTDLLFIIDILFIFNPTHKEAVYLTSAWTILSYELHRLAFFQFDWKTVVTAYLASLLGNTQLQKV